MRKRLFGGVAAAAALAVIGMAMLVPLGQIEAQVSDECASARGNRCLFIAKDTDPDAADEAFTFQYTHNGVTEEFTLSDGEQAVIPFNDVSDNVITELASSGWILDVIDCRNEANVDVNVQLELARVTIAMVNANDPDTTIECTFRNSLEFTPTPSSTPTETPSPTATATPEETEAASETATATPATPPTSVPPTLQPTSGGITPPSTGSGGLK